MDDPWVVLGEIVRPHGLRGEVRVRSALENPDNFLLPGLSLRLAGKISDPIRVKGWRAHKNSFLLTFCGRDSIEQVEKLVGAELVVQGSRLPEAEPGEYYHFQLFGLEVFDELGRGLGRLVEIIPTPGHDVFVIRDDQGSELLLPAVSAYILAVEPSAGRIVVDPQGGGRQGDDAD